jgi:hypothetical protein
VRLEHLLSGAMLSTIIVEKWYTRKAPWIVLHYVVYDIYSNQLTVNDNQLTTMTVTELKTRVEKLRLTGTDHIKFSPIAQLVRALH